MVAKKSRTKNNEHLSKGTDTRANLATNLQKLLDSLGWSVMDLQRRTGFSPHFLSGMMRGEQNPSIDNLDVIAQSFGIETYQLLHPRFDCKDKENLLKMLALSNHDVAELRKNTKRVTKPRRYLSKNLRNLLAVNGLSATALAEDVGVAASTVHKCLRGNQNITIEMLDLFAQGLHVSPFLLIVPTDE